MPEFRALLSNDSDMACRIREFDWAATSLGAPNDWPQSLRSALSICLNSNYPTAIYWGSELRLLYNDAWASVPGPRHPQALGQPAHLVWPDIWHVIGPQLKAVFAYGKGIVSNDQYLPMRRFGRLEETYWDYSFTPIAGEDGRVAGIFNQGQETTDRVFADRRSRLLLQLSDRIRTMDSSAGIMATALQTVGEHLGVGRVGYGEVDQAERLVRIDSCWASGSMRPLTGTMSFGSLGQAVHQAMRMGETFAVDDVYNDSRISEADVIQRYATLGIRSTAAVPILRDGSYTAALFVQNADPHSWSAGELLMLQGVAGRLWEELARSRSEMVLRESERRHRLIFEQARDIIFTADLEQTITACNPAAAEAIGLPAERIVGRSIADFVSPDEFDRTRSMLRRKLQDGGVTRYEVSVSTAFGETRQWDVNSALTIGTDERPIGLHAVARDITEKRAFDERQQLLINELNHRVKNTLALVQGLAMQSFRNQRSIADGQQSFQARLGMLAAAHDLLTQQCWEGATIDALVADAMGPYGDPPGRIVTAGPRVVLPPKAAISLVLALHELGTNAAKYGSLSRPEGKVELSWRLDRERALTLTWREIGGPQVIEPDSRGFGLRMIERALASDLVGTVDVAFRPAGLDCTITATLPEFA